MIESRHRSVCDEYGCTSATQYFEDVNSAVYDALVNGWHYDTNADAWLCPKHKEQTDESKS